MRLCRSICGEASLLRPATCFLRGSAAVSHNNCPHKRSFFYYSKLNFGNIDFYPKRLYLMKTPNFLKKRRYPIVITAVVLILCASISVYYATLPEKTILTFWGRDFSVDGSKAIVVSIAIIFGLLASFFINIFSGDLHETIKESDSADKKPNVIVPTVEIKNIINQPSDAPPPVAPSTNQKFYPAPFLPDLKFFVGREELLKQIKATLKKDHRAAIHDISGLGKTFTTYKFAEDNQENYEKIFFIRATREEMLESLAKCGETGQSGIGRGHGAAGKGPRF